MIWINVSLTYSHRRIDGKYLSTFCYKNYFSVDIILIATDYSQSSLLLHSWYFTVTNITEVYFLIWEFSTGWLSIYSFKQKRIISVLNEISLLDWILLFLKERDFRYFSSGRFVFYNLKYKRGILSILNDNSSIP